MVIVVRRRAAAPRVAGARPHALAQPAAAVGRLEGGGAEGAVARQIGGGRIGGVHQRQVGLCAPARAGCGERRRRGSERSIKRGVADASCRLEGARRQVQASVARHEPALVEERVAAATVGPPRVARAPTVAVAHVAALALRLERAPKGRVSLEIFGGRVKSRGDRNARQRLPARAAAPRGRRHVKGGGVLARDERRRGGRDCVGVALADGRVEARVAVVCAAVARDEEAAPKEILPPQKTLFQYITHINSDKEKIDY